MVTALSPWQPWEVLWRAVWIAGDPLSQNERPTGAYMRRRPTFQERVTFCQHIMFCLARLMMLPSDATATHCLCSQSRIAYLSYADNVSRLLPNPLSDVNQPVICS